MALTTVAAYGVVKLGSAGVGGLSATALLDMAGHGSQAATEATSFADVGATSFAARVTDAFPAHTQQSMFDEISRLQEAEALHIPKKEVNDLLWAAKQAIMHAREVTMNPAPATTAFVEQVPHGATSFVEAAANTAAHTASSSSVDAAVNSAAHSAVTSVQVHGHAAHHAVDHAAGTSFLFADRSAIDISNTAGEPLQVSHLPSEHAASFAEAQRAAPEALETSTSHQVPDISFRHPLVEPDVPGQMPRVAPEPINLVEISSEQVPVAAHAASATSAASAAPAPSAHPAPSAQETFYDFGAWFRSQPPPGQMPVVNAAPAPVTEASANPYFLVGLIDYMGASEVVDFVDTNFGCYRLRGKSNDNRPVVQ